MKVLGSTGKVLGYVNRTFDVPRLDLCDVEELIQVAAKCHDRGPASRAHRHLPQPRSIIGVVELWVVVSGAARVIVRENEQCAEQMIDLRAGDCYVSISGIHSLQIMEDGTRLYEIKNGPYLGQTADKEWIA